MRTALIVIATLVAIPAFATVIHAYGLDVPMVHNVTLFRIRGNTPELSVYERSALVEREMTNLLTELRNGETHVNVVVIEKQNGLALPKKVLGTYNPRILAKLAPYRNAKAVFANGHLVVLMLLPDEIEQNYMVWVENLQYGLCKKEPNLAYTEMCRQWKDILR